MVDLKLEVVVIPVADVDRAKQFYEALGWRLDADFPWWPSRRGRNCRRDGERARAAIA
jgi:catechol 2,3-dioxygenase-like lactoylglutathione lyase family enzyme